MGGGYLWEACERMDSDTDLLSYYFVKINFDGDTRECQCWYLVTFQMSSGKAIGPFTRPLIDKVVPIVHRDWLLHEAYHSIDPDHRTSRSRLKRQRQMGKKGRACIFDADKWELMYVLVFSNSRKTKKNQIQTCLVLWPKVPLCLEFDHDLTWFNLLHFRSCRQNRFQHFAARLPQQSSHDLALQTVYA